VKLERNCPCSLCQRVDSDPGCRELQAAMGAVDRALAEAAGRAYRHNVSLPPIAFYVNIPCWYAAREQKQQQSQVNGAA
jgi:hypothetical protein